LRRAIAVAVLSALAGCGGAAPSGSPAFATQAVRARVIRPDFPTSSSLIFEADAQEAQVNIYHTFELASNPPPIATIAVAHGCPYALAMDKAGTLYVADNCGGNDVEEYPRGETALKKSITRGISNPLGIAVDSHFRLYVSNGPATITEYANGATKPSRTISGAPLVSPTGLAVDKNANLYIADPGAGVVFKVPSKGSGVTALALQGLEQPVNVAVDLRTNYLWVTDAAADKIDVYKLGSTSPALEISGAGSPYAVGVENKGKPKGEMVESDLTTHGVYAFDPSKSVPYAILSNGIEDPMGLLIQNP